MEQVGDAAALIAALEARGDPLSLAAAGALGRPFAPDAMAAAVDRLLVLLRTQEAQIAALEALVEARL